MHKPLLRLCGNYVPQRRIPKTCTQELPARNAWHKPILKSINLSIFDFKVHMRTYIHTLLAPWLAKPHPSLPPYSSPVGLWGVRCQAIRQVSSCRRDDRLPQDLDVGKGIKCLPMLKNRPDLNSYIHSHSIELGI